tara:strand:- start:5051 stop:5512 length:462 start_codon:yes stop_codon:yes gene_type:complete
MPVKSQTASGREIATVKTDVAALGHMLTKVEQAIGKISETHQEMGKILAVHEERLDSQEKERMQRRKESDDAVKELHSRISTGSRETQAHISKSEEKILNTIEALRQEINKEQDHMEERIRKLEQWRWILIGILVAVSALFPNIGKIVSMLGS